MPEIRSCKLLALAAAVALVAACGGGDGGGTPGTGGGGTGGGTGGSGGSDVPSCVPDREGMPKACSIEPNRGPVGSVFVIHGVNFSEINAKNQVRFGTIVTPVSESTSTSLKAQVPAGAVSGRLSLAIDLGDGFLSVEGPEFTVTDEKPVPKLSSISPSSITQGSGDLDIGLSGSGFVTSSRVLWDGEPIASTLGTSTSLKIKVPADRMAQVGAYRVQVINDPPGGGESDVVEFTVVRPVSVVRAEAVASNVVRLTFDRPVSRGSAAPSRNPERSYRISPTLAVSKVDMDGKDPSAVLITTRTNQVPDTSYTVAVIGSITSTEGGVLRAPTSATFRAFNSAPIADGSFGTQGCDAKTLSGPAGLTVAARKLFVTEESGNQVQAVSTDGATPSFTGFYGHDGSRSGLISGAGSAAGCPSGVPTAAEALMAPRGAVGYDPISGDIYVGDTGNDRVVKYTASGVFSEFVRGDGAVKPEDHWTDPVVLGFLGGEIFVATSDEKIHRLQADGSKEPKPYGGPGLGINQFGFGTVDGGIPAMAVDTVNKVSYIVEPGNHRVQKVAGIDATNPASRGAIGKGVDKFGSVLPQGEPGTGPGEFTWPRGVAVDKSGVFYVIDEALGGRLQRFTSQGALMMQIRLDYLPGGIAIDESDTLWIVDQAGARLYRYRL